MGLARNILSSFAWLSKKCFKTLFFFDHGTLKCILFTENWNMIILSHTWLKKERDFDISFLILTCEVWVCLRSSEQKTPPKQPHFIHENTNPEKLHESSIFTELVTDRGRLGLKSPCFGLFYLTSGILMPCHKGLSRYKEV